MGADLDRRPRDALLAERARLAPELGEAIVAPGQMTYGSQAAAASQVFEQQRDLALRDRAAEQLALVEAALARLDDGSFGDCVRCGKPIAPARLEALPWAATASTASATSTAAPADGGRRTGGRAPLVTIEDIRAAAETLRGVAIRTPLVAVRTAGGPPVPEGRVAPADRRVQAARRLRRRRLARAGRAGARRHHLLVGQPRPGRRARGAAARHPGRRRHAVRRAGHQARAGRRGRRRGHRRRDRRARSVGWSPSGSPPSAG